MKKCLSMLLAVIMLVCLLPVAEVSAALVFQVSINGVDLPVAGSKPDLTATLGDASDMCKITRVEWTEYDEGWEWQKDMTANDTFREGYWYVVFVRLEANSGNTFGSSVAGTINGQSAKKDGNAVQENGTKVSFYVSYQATRQLTAINKVDLTVVKPVIGKTPTFAKVDTTQYVSEKYGTVSNCSNGVTWTNQGSGVNITVSNPFKENTKYKVTYYLTAKDGYKFTTSTACTINGVKATFECTDHFHAKVSLGDLVPGDGKKEIASLDLSVTAPKDGEKPAYTKIDGTGYYSDNGANGSGTRIYKNGIAWYKSASAYISPGTTETFAGGTEYTVKISLLPKDGYKFAQNITAKINGKAATVETLNDGSVNVSVKLTAAQKNHTHTAGAAWQYDDTEHWKICADANCGTVVGNKTMHANSDADGKCDICGYQLPIEVPEGTTPSATTPVQKPTTGTATEPVDTTAGATDETAGTDASEPTEVPTTDEAADNDNGSGVLLWVILGVVVLAAGAAAAIVVLKKKKAQ